MRRGGRLEAVRLFCVLMLIEKADGHGYGASAWTGRWFDGRIQPGIFSQRKPDTGSLVTPVDSCGLPRRSRAGALRDLLLVPTPRPMITTVPNFSISGGLTQGTDNVQDAAPGFEQFEQVSGLARPLHVTRLTVPRSESERSMIRGIRSPCSWRRKMMNCPGFCLPAIRGASMTKRLMAGAMNSA